MTWASMICGYARMGLAEYAREVFDEMPRRCSAPWNAMIVGYVEVRVMIKKKKKKNHSNRF